MIDLACVPRRRADVRFRRVGSEAVVLVQDEARVLGVYDVGGRVLELADGSRTVDALLEALGGEFAVDRATLEADVLPFLERLLAAGAIVLSSAGSDGP